MKKNIIKIIVLYHFQTTKQKHTLMKFYFNRNPSAKIPAAMNTSSMTSVSQFLLIFNENFNQIKVLFLFVLGFERLRE